MPAHPPRRSLLVVACLVALMCTIGAIPAPARADAISDASATADAVNAALGPPAVAAGGSVNLPTDPDDPILLGEDPSRSISLGLPVAATPPPTAFASGS
jgi:hypothetical protein